MEHTNTTHHNSESNSEHSGEHKHEHEHEHKHHEGHHSEHDGDEEVKLPKNRSKIIKIALIAAVAVVIVGLLYSFKGVFVAAIVDGHLISRYTVLKELERQGGKDALNTLIDKQLINNEAKKQKITVSDDEINVEMKKFEDQFSTGGQNLDAALEAENLTRDDLKKQIFIRKEIEKLIGNKADVSDEELQTYMTENKVVPPAGQEEDVKNQVKDQLHQQKLGQFSTDLLKNLRSKAKIRTFVDYKGGAAQQE